MDLREMIAQQWARYERLNDREQLLVIATSCIFILGMLIILIWEPLHNARETARSHYYEELELQDQLQGLQGGKAGSSPTKSNRSLLAIVNASTAENGINLKRVEPRNDESLRIWMDNIQFNQLIGWISSLQNQYGLQVETISLDKSDTEGYVNSALVLTR